MTRCGLFGLALGLVEVASVRQRVDTTLNPVEAIGALLQERNMGSEELLHQLSEYAAVTPGAEGSFVKKLKALAQDIETQVEKKITDGQTATQGKLDSLFNGLETTNAAANTAKKDAVGSDESWFKCAAEEQAKRQKAEAAEQHLTNSRSNENEACQLQQDNRGFKFDATGKYKLDFACDHGVAGNCQAALKTWQETVLQQMFADAEAALGRDKKQYNGLKASCDTKKASRVQAQSSLNSAESVWSNKRAACNKLASQRRASMCAFGTKAQAKCSAEADYAVLVAATKRAQGDADSEVDRESEWIASGTTKCMIEKSVLKGLKGNVDEADLNACSGQVNFAQEVGKLNLRENEFDTLSKTNACADGPITFFNGQTWNVPAGANPSSKSYTRTKFTPQLNPTSGNFDFCSAPAPAPVPEAPAPAPVPEAPAPAPVPEAPAPAPEAPKSTCSQAALDACQGNVPCIDLREGAKHHHLMWLNADGTAHVKGAANNFNDNRAWTCSCSGACKGLVGTWHCPKFYDSKILITPDYGDDFTAVRPNDHIDVCAVN